ncbi:MAG: cytochrome ubiquinol oxidase subunit I, partial [Bryobacterales bacterium]|nr:cytochrome ubiquinol oxidase subunit I [Bryobacterales bacterium]
LFLSRLQFALTIMFHYLFPPFSIGLGLLMVFMEGLYLRTGDKYYEAMTRFWTKIFAVNFAMGVASGIVMEFQFGTNWATYSRYVGDIFGSALAAEGIFAFFLESGFLAVLVFGWDRVSPKMHFFSTCMVALGATFSAVWIVVANSWQQTPAGYHIVGEGLNARAEITDFWAMVFNPSSMDRLGHVLLGAWIQGAFLVLSISAYYLLRNRHREIAIRGFQIALVLGTFAACTQLFSGHQQGKKIATTQPAKLAAYEGHYKTSESATLYLFGIPNSETKQVDFGVGIPGMLDALVGQPVRALDSFPQNEIPPVQIPFQTYHIMILIGFYLIGLTLLGCLYWWRGKLFDTRWLLKIFAVSVIFPIIANQAGWIAAEVGRQPWIVYGLLRTDQSVSKAVRAEEVLISIVMFTVIYAMLFAVWVFVLNAKIVEGPEDPLNRPQGPGGSGKGFFEAAAEVLHPEAGFSMTAGKSKGGNE